MNYNQLVACKVKDARKEAGYSAEYVANMLHRTKGAYSHLENGKVEVTVSTLDNLAKIFNKPMAYFLPNIEIANQITVNKFNGKDYSMYTKNLSYTTLLDSLQENLATLQAIIDLIKEDGK